MNPLIKAIDANLHVLELQAENKTLKEENERLRQELGYIANAQRKNFTDPEEFRVWAQNRAQHALNQKPGTLTVGKP